MSIKSGLTKLGAALSLAVLAAGCAHSPNDPLEGYNRQAFYFTEAMDTVVVKPVATGYHELVPEVVQTMVGNFFGNIADVWIAFNNFLQGRGDEGFSDVSRVMVNTFAGIGGLIDVASDAGLPKHNEDFGQTLGVWGVPSGPYFFIPILGPSTIRDTVAAPADYWFGDPITYIDNDTVKWSMVALRGISKRAELLDASTVIDDAAIDKYEFLRDAYLQRRQRMVHDKDLADDQWESVSEEKKEAEFHPWMPSSGLHPETHPATEEMLKAEAETTSPAPAEKNLPAARDETAGAPGTGPATAETAARIN